MPEDTFCISEGCFSLPFFWGRGVQALRLSRDFCTVFSCLGLLFHVPWCCHGPSETLSHLVKAKVYIFLLFPSPAEGPLLIQLQFYEDFKEMIERSVMRLSPQESKRHLSASSIPLWKLVISQMLAMGTPLKSRTCLCSWHRNLQQEKTKAHFLVTKVPLPSFV